MTETEVQMTVDDMENRDRQEEEPVETGGNLKGRIEAILFVSGEAVEVEDLCRALDTPRGEVEQALREIRDEYDFQQRGFVLRRFGTHVQLTTRALYAPDVVHLLQPVQKQTLSQALMETLAIIAYRQNVTRGEMEAIRGVKCDYSVQVLLARGLIEEKGRRDTLGHPVEYGTTDAFLQHFGIASLAELP